MTIFLFILLSVGAVILDQLTKLLAVNLLKPIDTCPIIKDVLHLTYSENTGAAFGMLKNARWVFMVFSAVAIIAIIAYFFTVKPTDKLCVVSLAFILGGGIGNMIDRIFIGYVVDFIDFRLIDFAIFNGADSFITVGAALLVLYFIISEVKTAREKKNESKDN
ncbi:MAG: signal peptidase II [Clostridia bacterium]|nr:signal peptidase II [Clostridia bacterium]